MSASLNLIQPYPDRIQGRPPEEIRHNYRLITVFLICSLTVHAGLFIHLDSTGSRPPEPVNMAHSINVELNHLDARQRMPAHLQRDKPDQQPSPEKATPPAEAMPEPVIATRPAHSVAIRAEQRETATPDAPRPAREATGSRETQAPVMHATTEQQGEQHSPRSSVIESQKQQYLQRVAAHLDRYKFYPRSARRRYIEGRVEVCFDLLENGDISHLALLSGHSSLRKATKEAIYHALPLPARPDNLRTLGTIRIEYAMQYSLQD